jgi:hypothetical protein
MIIKYLYKHKCNKKKIYGGLLSVESNNYDNLEAAYIVEMLLKYGDTFTDVYKDLEITFKICNASAILCKTFDVNMQITQENYRVRGYLEITLHSKNSDLSPEQLHDTFMDDFLSSIAAEIPIKYYEVGTEIGSGGQQTAFQTVKNVFISKKRSNLSLAKNIEDELFNGISSFLESKENFKRRGTPYTRGYILYGPPGTGKTSIIKTISAEYDIPIVAVNLNNVDNETTLKALFSKVTTLIERDKINVYLLIFEDFDRAKFFKNKDCMDMLYNFLDGVDEMKGRIAIITCNDHVSVLEDKALFRAGRFDKALHISYADRSQVEKMLRVFYDDSSITFTDDISDHSVYNPIVPAQIQEIMFSNQENVDEAISEIRKYISKN